MVTYRRLPPSTLDTVVADLHHRGVAVVPGVLSNVKCDALRQKAAAELKEMTCDAVDLDDKSTWVNWSKFFPMHSMLMQHFGIGHQRWLWDIRQTPSVAKVFAKIWGVDTEDLLVSFDGASFHLPPESTNNKGWFRGNMWMHTDQSPNKKGLQCVQGVVNLLDVREGDATFCFYPGSHLLHEEFFEKHCSPPPDPKNVGDWYKLNDEGVKYFESKCNNEKIAVIADAGDLILWDSRTFHQGIEPMKGREKEDMRVAAYVCYTPRKWATEKDLKRKMAHFIEGRTTTHWPHAPKAFPKGPRTYGNPLPRIEAVKPMDKDDMTIFGLRFAGFLSKCQKRKREEDA